MSVWKCGKCGNVTRTAARGPAARGPACPWCHVKRFMVKLDVSMGPAQNVGLPARARAHRMMGRGGD